MRKPLVNIVVALAGCLLLIPSASSSEEFIIDVGVSCVGDDVRQSSGLLAIGGAAPNAGPCYANYVRNYADLLAYYNATGGGGRSIEDWGKSHW